MMAASRATIPMMSIAREVCTPSPLPPFLSSLSHRTDRGIQRQNEKRNSLLPVFVTSDRRRKRRRRRRAGKGEKRRLTPRSPASSPASGRFISEVFKRRGSSRTTRTERRTDGRTAEEEDQK